MSPQSVKFLFLFIAVLCSFVGQAKELHEGPFFWEKPEIQGRMKKERFIPVSVISQKEGGIDIWSMKGAGIVLAPCDYTFQWVQNFETLKKMKDHFPEVTWNQEKTELDLSVQILTRAQKVKFQLWRNEQETTRKLHYKVTEGPFLGSEGVILFKNASHHQCEIGLIGSYKGKLIAFGSSVFAIAVEGLLQHVAKSLRTGVENDWPQSEFTKKP